MGCGTLQKRTESSDRVILLDMYVTWTIFRPHPSEMFGWM